MLLPLEKELISRLILYVCVRLLCQYVTGRGRNIQPKNLNVLSDKQVHKNHSYTPIGTLWQRERERKNERKKNNTHYYASLSDDSEICTLTWRQPNKKAICNSVRWVKANDPAMAKSFVKCALLKVGAKKPDCERAVTNNARVLGRLSEE